MTTCARTSAGNNLAGAPFNSVEVHMRRSIVLVVVACLPTVASAQESPTPTLLVGLGRIHPVLVGAFGGGHSHGGRSARGWFLGADTGWAWFVSMPSSSTARAASIRRDDAWCFGARSGYQLASGLAVQARFDNLGVDAPDGSGTLDTVSVGVRYSIPIVPMPYAEAMIGPTFHGSDAAASAGVGVGVSLLVGRHVAFDGALRDWVVDLGGVRHIPAVAFGITAGFGG